MHPTNLGLFLSIYIPLYLATHIGLFMLFRKAGVKMAWMAFVPVLCYWPWIKLAGRPKTWMIWALIPAADIIIWFSLVIDLMESFGRFKFAQQAAGVLVPFYIYPRLAFDKKVVYLGVPRDPAFRKKYIGTKGWKREWTDAIFFALVVAYMIRMFQLEPYKIPSPSMEDSMLVGDFLLVSKMNYGPRFPMTPIAFPLVHQDFLGAKAYSELIELPYMRLPGFQDIKRNDPVVFNVPWDQLDPTPRPVDKMQNYVKRCVGVPGDKLELKNGILYINDQLAYQPEKMLHNYYIRFKSGSAIPTDETLTEEYDIYDFHLLPTQNLREVNKYTISITLSKEDLERIKTDFSVEAVKQDIAPRGGNYFSPECSNEGCAEFNAIIKVKDSQQLSDADFKKLGVVYFEPLSSDRKHLLVMMDEEFINPQKYALIPKIDSIKRKTQLQSITGKDPFPGNMQIYPWNKDNYGPVYLPKRGEKVKINSQNFYFYERAIKEYENNLDFELRGSIPYLNGKAITEYEFKMDYYWMMGDNRDNSLDSRFWGYVPEDHIVGKPLFVFFSVQYKQLSRRPDDQQFVKIRWNRLFKGIK